MTALANAIDDLYDAFKDIKAPSEIVGCPCCIDEVTLAKICATPLRELSPDDLSPYASSALLTVGDVRDYLYLLPRILEISVYDEYWWPDIAVTGRAVNSIEPGSWPEFRQKALHRFLDATIEYFVRSKNYSPLDDWMCAIATMDVDVRPFLSIIETSDPAVLEFFNDNSGTLSDERLTNAFWKLPNIGHDMIVKWFKSEKISKIPFEAYGYKF